MSGSGTRSTPDPSSPGAKRHQFISQLLAHKGTEEIGNHSLVLLEVQIEQNRAIEKLRQIVREHYIAPETTAKRLAALGAPRTAALFKEHLPTSKTSRSGDIGEILATEVAESRLAYEVPIRRLRWKDGRDMALRGDDIIGLLHGKKNRLQILKGESKSRAKLASTVIDEASDALSRDRGRPTRHSVLFVAERLREQSKDDLAKELEDAVLESFRECSVEHLLFVLTGTDPKNLLSNHLKLCAKKKHRRHTVGVRIKEHAKFIYELFEGL
jgi:hypothetical protein